MKLPADYLQRLQELDVGYTKLLSRANGLAMDYVRRGWFTSSALKEVPPDAPGADNDLKDKVETAVVKAVDQAGALVYAFGDKWGPEKNKKDQYFKFLPGNGIHDIHMNQGNSGNYKKDNGAYQDGGLVFQYPNGTWRGFFFAFQSQSFATDDQGNPSAGAQGHKKQGKTARAKSRKRPRRGR